MPKDSEKYSAKEAKRRFEAALRGGLNTPPKPLKDIAPKSARKTRKKKQRR